MNNSLFRTQKLVQYEVYRLDRFHCISNGYIYETTSCILIEKPFIVVFLDNCIMQCKDTIKQYGYRNLKEYIKGDIFSRK